MNISQINYMQDLKIDNTSYKVASSTNDKNSFKDILDKSAGVDKTANKVESREASKPKDVDSINEVDKKTSKVDGSKVENEVQEKTENKVEDQLELTSNEENNKVLEEDKIDFPGNKDEEGNEEVISTLSSLLNLLNTIKNQLETTEISEQEASTEIRSLASDLIEGKVSIKDILSDENISSDLNETLKANNFDKLFSEKDSKLAQDIMKLFTSELTDGTKDNDIKTTIDNLLAKVSEVLNDVSTTKIVKSSDQNQSLIDKLTTLISEDLEETVTKVETKTKTNEFKGLLGEQPKKSDFDVLEQKVQYRTITDTSSNSAKVTSEDKTTYLKSEDTAKEDKFLSGILNDNSKEENTIQKLVQFTPINNTTALGDVSQEVPVVSKNTVVQDIIETFKYMEDSSLKELTVKIKPKELGEITIKLVAQGEVMKANINASNKEAYDLLNSKVTEIKHALNTQNIKIEDVSIDFNDSFQSFQSGEGNFSRDDRNSSQNTTKYSSKDGIEDNDMEENLGVSSNLNILA